VLTVSVSACGYSCSLDFSALYILLTEVLSSLERTNTICLQLQVVYYNRLSLELEARKSLKCTANRIER